MNTDVLPAHLREPGDDVGLLQRQVLYLSSTLQAIANAYAHGPKADEPGCWCAACVARRAISRWDKELNPDGRGR